MIKSVLQDCEERMQKAINVLDADLKSLRAGRATPALLDKITVDYYGVKTPLKQVSNISVPEARLIVIQPWDKSMMSKIEKAIMLSDLGLMPSNDGKVIRLSIPSLTQERRVKLTRLVHQKGEDCKVAIRNIRRDANEEIKLFEHEGEISEDDAHRALDDVQELTNKYTKKTDVVLKAKQDEIMEV